MCANCDEFARQRPLLPSEMAIPTLFPTSTTLAHSSAHDHPHHPVSLGLGTGEFGKEKLPCKRMEARSEVVEESPMKKVKRASVEVETVLKQTAEIEMVLVGMAALRAGAPPTTVECDLAIEAYTNLAGLAERVPPQDLVSKKTLQSLIEQLTSLQGSALPPVTPTLAQHAAAFVRRKSTKAASAATAKTAKTAGKRLADNVPPLYTGKRKRGRPPKEDKPFKNLTNRAKYSQSAPITGTLNNVPPLYTGKRKRGRPPKQDTPFKSLTNRAKYPQSAATTGAIKGRGGKRLLRRGGKGLKTLAGLRGRIVQRLTDQHEAHQQIALAVLQSKPNVVLAAVPESARAYISSPITCDICKQPANDTASVLVCDGCGLGFHVRCLKMHERLDIPEKDWYCSKCVAASGGRPKQPIYGLLRRGPGGRPGNKTTWILQAGHKVHSTKALGKPTVQPTVQLRNRGGKVGTAPEEGELSAGASTEK